MKMKIKDRIRAALSNGRLSYFELAYQVFPQDDYPKAFRYQANGGPPGCYMALSKALREMGEEISDHTWSDGRRYVYLKGRIGKL